MQAIDETAKLIASQPGARKRALALCITGDQTVSAAVATRR